MPSLQAAAARKTQDTSPVLLFVEILNKYLYYFDQDLPLITPEVLKVTLGTPSPNLTSQSNPRKALYEHCIHCMIAPHPKSLLILCVEYSLTGSLL